MATITKKAFLQLGGLLGIKHVASGTFANAVPKQFGTGSVGYSASIKLPVVVPTTINRNDWERQAPALRLEVGGVPMDGTPMVFSTGTLGWNFNGKVSKDVDGTIVRCQVSLNPAVPHSKPDALETVDAGIHNIQLTANITAVKSKEWAND